MIYVYAKYQKPTPYIKRDIANVKVFYHAGQPAGRHRHYIDSHCIACESNIGKSVFVAVQDSCTYAGTKLCLNEHYLCETFCLGWTNHPYVGINFSTSVN